MEENLNIFLKDFGVALAFQLPNGEVVDKDQKGKQLLGLFDKTYADPNLGYLKTKIDKPTLTCIEEDVQEVVKGSTVSIKNVLYKVLDIDDDATGFVSIKLTKIVNN